MTTDVSTYLLLLLFIVASWQQACERTDIVGWQPHLGRERVRDVADLGSIWRCALESFLKGQVCTLKTVQFLGVHLKEGAVDELVAARACLRVNVQHLLHECPDVVGVVVRNPRVNAFAHALV